MTTAPKVGVLLASATVLILAILTTWWQHLSTVILTSPVASVGSITQTTALLRVVYPAGYEPSGHGSVELRSGTVGWAVPEAKINDLGTSETLLTGLSPGRQYSYALAPAKGELSKGSFATFAATGSSTSFLFGSCIMTQLMLAGIDLDPFVRLAGEVSTDFLLLLGDSIYADVFPMASFASKYRQLWAQPSFQALARTVPIYAMYDDHEVRNNWGGPATAKLGPALVAWRAFLGGRGTLASGQSGRSFFSFSPLRGLLDVFVLDTRFYRGVDEHHPLLGSAQHAALVAWLAGGTRSRLKIIASPASFSLGQGWSLGAFLLGDGDGWNLAAAEREALFDQIQLMQCDGRVKGGVVLLSGDVHYSTILRQRPNLYELGSTPLHAFPLPKHQNYNLSEEVLFSSSSRWCNIGRVTVEWDDCGKEALLRAEMLGYRPPFQSRPELLYSLELREADMRPTTEACAALLMRNSRD